MFVIKRIPDGAFVSKPGSYLSYTKDLQKANHFRSHKVATANLCPENEQVVAVQDLIFVS